MKTVIKTITYYFIASIMSICLAQPQYQANYKIHNDETFNSLFREITDGGWLHFKENTNVAPGTFFSRYASNLGISESYILREIKNETDNESQIRMRHQLFQLHYKNIPVEGCVFSLHSSDNVLKVAHGRIVPGLDINVVAQVDMQTALNAAMEDQKLTSESFSETEKPIGKLILTRTDENFLKESYRLAYVFELKSEKITHPYQVFVDAQNGQILKRIPLFRSCSDAHKPLVASVMLPNYNRYLNGQANLGFETEIVGNQYRLSAYGNKLNTRIDVNSSGNWNNNPDVFNPTTNWSNANSNATTAHYLGQKVHEMYQLLFGRNGINGGGSYPKILVGWNSVGAECFGDMLRFGSSPLNNSLVCADVLGHEYTHAVISNTANLVYQGEPGALNESISDIMGTTLEFYLFGAKGNYELGEDADQIRSMSNPRQGFPIWGGQPQPDTYLGADWVPTNSQDDHGGVHTNSGVMNKWYWFMRTGGPTGTPLDYNKPARIVYRALQFYLHQNSTYYDAVEATEQAGIDLYGACSDVARQVSYAWTQVGIQSSTSCTDCNFTITATASPAPATCGAPITLTANCVGSGCNHINSYGWTGSNIVGSSVGKSVQINAPAAQGAYLYNVSTIKLGCFLNVAPVTVNTQCGQQQVNACSAEFIAGYGNTSENYTYTVNVASAGSYKLKANYARWEGNTTVVGSVKVNGGANQTMNFAYTGGSENYQDATLVTSLKAGNNTIQIFGGPQGYFKTKKVCVQSGARVGSENYTDDIVMNNESPLFTSPNPSSGEFDVSFFLEKSKEAQISVLNNQGTSIYKKHLTGKGMHKEKVILPDHQSGSFILILKKENGLEYSKIVVVE
ncbi:M4 family metallopeptidase [Dyadobacter bucti]|uniref:M4 family metallopeptidase n=1 Tax=Dyadobacter bucti TaxID=2572203 RepID=UPI0011083C2F|nr:M4 family metallopeptidase [Dyadobacter bucti]